MLPDKINYNPDPQYLRNLLDKADLTQISAAKLIGVSPRTFRDYLNGNHPSEAPYPVQFCLECLAVKEN